MWGKLVGTRGRLTYIEPQCMVPRVRLHPLVARLPMEIGKDLVAASATPLILAIVAEADTYGYAILKRVGELSGGRLQWTDGMLYPVLHRLEKQGHIEGVWGTSETGRRRKYYSITIQGLAELAEQRQQWQAVDAALRSIWKVPPLLGTWTADPSPARG